MPNNVSRIDSVLNLTGFPSSVKNVPANWPQRPSPNKVSLLWEYNTRDIYHKFSPYTDGENPFGIVSNKQPFIYRYIDDTQSSKFNEMDPKVKTLASSFNLTKDTVDDVVRVSKWLLTGKGILWNAKQLILQNSNPFDETGLYNPLSPVVATISPFTLNIIRPMRHIEGGVFGLVTSQLGISSTTIRYPPPNSTVGANALGRESSNGGKGLLRGRTASEAYNKLKTAWSTGISSNGIFGNSLGGSILAGATSLAVSFLGTTAKQPQGTIVRADESTYSSMASNTGIGSRLSYVGVDGEEQSSYQFTYAPSKVSINNPKKKESKFDKISKVSSTVMGYIKNPLSLAGNALSSLLGGGTGLAGPYKRSQWYPTPNLSPGQHRHNFLLLKGNQDFEQTSFPINGKNEKVGYEWSDDSMYGDIIGIGGDSDFINSHILNIYGRFYGNSKFEYDSKLQNSKNKSIQDLNDGLKRLINNINKSGLYSFNATNESRIITSISDDPSNAGYNRIASINRQPGQSVSTPSVSDDYCYTKGINIENFVAPRTVDKSVRASNGLNIRMATSFTSDGINLLGVLNKDRKTYSSNDIMNNNLSNAYPNWTVYNPYDDDLIAFFFYDVVNEKYIPFRATLKGISETATAFWDELRFIGRADQLYTYNGFNRSLSFTFHVVINSISELLPTWKRLNYLAGAVKPSNYTKSDKAGLGYSNYLVPPMFMITIGDLYKYQPIVINSITFNIPDDASWETLSEESSIQEWSYLNGIITSNVGKNFAQVPKEIDISIGGYLLEKERAQIGGCHFGHAPRGEEGGPGAFVEYSDEPYLPVITTFNRELIEPIETGGVTPPKNSNRQTVTDSSTSTINNASNNKPFQLLSIKESLNLPTTRGIEMVNGIKNEIKTGAQSLIDKNIPTLNIPALK